MKWVKSSKINIGDLVKSVQSPWGSIQYPKGHGVVTEIKGEILYVYWGSNKPKPISIRLLKVLK
tara:strand:- start:1410 stop:1601 length:192 start_codon:yes stop_codon:yes gene_type:complete